MPSLGRGACAWIVPAITPLLLTAGCLLLTGCVPLAERGNEGETPRGGSAANVPDRPTPHGNDGSADVQPKAPIDPTPEVRTPAKLSGYGSPAADQISADSVATLKIRTGRGTVKIIGDPTAKIVRAEAEIRSWAENFPEAERIVREISVQFVSRDTENPALIIPEPQLAGRQDYVCDLKLTLPPKVRVSIENSGGDVTITNLRAGLDVVHSGGELNISGIQGGVEVDARGTSCVMEQLTGKVVVKDRTGSLRIGFVTGEVVVEDPSGELVIHSITGDVTARNNTGQPKFLSIEGDLTLVGISHNKAEVQGVSGSVVYPSSGN